MRKALLLLSAIAVLTSCDSPYFYSEQKDFPQEFWAKNEAVVFSVPIKDTLSKNEVLINIRNNNHYPFSNLFLVSQIDYPNGRRVVDTLEYAMADKQGNWLGVGMTDIKESELILKQGIVFPVQGVYRIELRQVMRRLGELETMAKLDGIVGVGISIEKNK